MQYNLKKSLGQHFLKDENICKKIAAQIEQTLKEHGLHHLLEIGPGGGALTKYLQVLPDINFKAIEVDKEKAARLREIYPAFSGNIIHADFLKMNVPFEGAFCVAGNFPYNISSQILFKILGWKVQVPAIIGMFQKEVAQRIAAQNGHKIYGITSVLLQSFYNIEILFDVSPRSFIPSPKVMSTVVKLTKKKQAFKMTNEKDFFKLVKTAFNQRRKTLRNAAKELFDEQVLTDSIFNNRAEQLTLEAFAALTFKMK